MRPSCTGQKVCNPKYGCKGVVTICFALIALIAWKHWLDSTLRKIAVHPEYGWNGTVPRAFPLIALIALVAAFHSAPGRPNVGNQLL